MTLSGKRAIRTDMNKIIFLLFLSLILTGCDSTPQNTQQQKTVVDTILNNGKFYTLNPEQPFAESVAIRDGSIIAVGDTKAIKAEYTATAKVIDLQGDAVLPGFSDFHVHPVYAGLQARRCVIPQGADLVQIQAIVKECIARAEPGAWITGGQWDAAPIGRIPDRTMLDVVALDNPVFLGDTSEHSYWANTKALEIAGITRNTENPENGIIERDSEGEPTGVFREDAIMLVRAHIPKETAEEVQLALKWAIDQMLSNGITSFTEASAGYTTSNVDKEVRAFIKLAEAGVLRQRVRICLPWAPGIDVFEKAIADRHRYKRDRINPDCIKIGLDGVPTDSHTAAMLEPYADTVEGRDDEASRYGILAVKQDSLNEAVTRFDSMGMTVKFHAGGDAAVRAGLDAVTAARQANGLNEQWHNVAHNAFIAREDIHRGKEINASYEMSPYLWHPSPINDSIIRAVGEERVKRIWPIRQLIEAGALVVPGSDWSVVPSVNPWVGIETLITRERPGGSEDSLGKGQAITLDQAIQMFTVNSAKHMGKEDKLGRIKTGMLADLIVLDRDPYNIPVTELHKVTVLKTIIHGEVVYEVPFSAF